ncbi:MAG: hypothetical protein ABSH44_11375 [Bryobacteraceae bacterium]|jgi:hypothetical protein
MSQIIDQAEALRQQAIGLLLAERQTIDRTLALLGYDGVNPAAPTRAKTCAVCGSPEHNARFHKNRAPGSEEASATMQETATQPHA